MNQEQLKQEFLGELQKYPNMEKVEKFLSGIGASFFNVPATCHGYGSFKGGLAVQSLLTYFLFLEKVELEKSRLVYSEKEGKEALDGAWVALLHDVYKYASAEEYLKNVKNATGGWDQELHFRFKEDELYLPKNLRSAHIVENIRGQILSRSEKQALVFVGSCTSDAGEMKATCKANKTLIVRLISQSKQEAVALDPTMEEFVAWLPNFKAKFSGKVTEKPVEETPQPKPTPVKEEPKKETMADGLPTMEENSFDFDALNDFEIAIPTPEELNEVFPIAALGVQKDPELSDPDLEALAESEAFKAAIAAMEANGEINEEDLIF